MPSIRILLLTAALGAEAVAEHGEYRLTPFGWFHRDCVRGVPSNTHVKETAHGTLELTFPNATVAAHARCAHASSRSMPQQPHNGEGETGAGVGAGDPTSWEGWPEHIWYGTDLAPWDVPALDGVITSLASTYTIPARPVSTAPNTDSPWPWAPTLSFWLGVQVALGCRRFSFLLRRWRLARQSSCVSFVLISATASCVAVVVCFVLDAFDVGD